MIINNYRDDPSLTTCRFSFPTAQNRYAVAANKLSDPQDSGWVFNYSFAGKKAAFNSRALTQATNQTRKHSPWAQLIDCWTGGLSAKLKPLFAIWLYEYFWAGDKIARFVCRPHPALGLFLVEEFALLVRNFRLILF